MLERIVRIIDLIIFMLLSIVMLTASNPILGEPVERARGYTRAIEFDYVSWSADAALLKLQSSFLGLPGYLTHEERKQVVMQHLFLTERILQAEDQLNRIYADPEIIRQGSCFRPAARRTGRYVPAPEATGSPVRKQPCKRRSAPLLAELNLTSGGQPIPPVLYHSSAVPMGLIISPRERIEQLTNISVQPNLTRRSTSRA